MYGKNKMKKRGVFFSVDAAIALSIILLTVIIVYPLVQQERQESHSTEDILNVLSTLRIGEIDNSNIKSLIDQGIITNINKTILEQIGEFYVTNETIARNISYIILDSLDTNENIGIWFDDKLIASKNSSPYETAEFVDLDREFLSGIKNGSSVTGFSARAYLISNLQSKYFYFGGYVGEGNISKIVRYNGTINDVKMELAINKDFEVYVNGIKVANFSKSLDSYTPGNYSLPIDEFVSGDNLLELRGDNLYIAGGYVKILYESELEYEQPDRYNFPGISGAINLYDSFYVPNIINVMNISLHFMNNYSTFLSIGNVIVFNNSTSGINQTIILNNTFLTSKLNENNLSMNNLSMKTVPIRFGLENASYSSNLTRPVDVFSVTDLSGSMCDCSRTFISSCRYDQQICEINCAGVCKGGIYEAKEANDNLIEAILNESRNQLGLVGYRNLASDDDFHDLSKDIDGLHDEIAEWYASGGTCICCGINKATNSYSIKLNESKGLVAYYTFDDNTKDITNSGLDGTIYGSPSYVSGINGSSLEFHGNLGNSDYVRIPNNESIGMDGMDELTFSMWIYPQSDSQYWHIGGTTNDWDGDGYNFYLRGTKTNEEYTFTIDSSSSGDYARGGNIVINKWHHLAGTYDGTTMRLYLDGVQIDTASGKSGSINPNDRDLYIGRIYGYAQDYFYGRIDEVRVYNRALNITEIRGLNDTTPTCGNGIIEVSELCDSENIICDAGGGNYGISSCNSSCTGFSSCSMTSVCGDGLKNSTEECDDGNTNKYDGCSDECKIEERFKAMIVMSDGEANEECLEQNTGNAKSDAIQAACDAYNNYGITVHAVGFGTGADETTLQAIAMCGNGSYYYSGLGDLSHIYQEIAENIIKATFNEQTIESTAGLFSILYPDSYIEFDYVKNNSYGLIIDLVENFSDNSTGDFILPDNSSILETRVVSYSGPRWTDTLRINNDLVYNLSEYGKTYIKLGDPYVVNIPNYLINKSNSVNITTGLSPTNISGGSIHNKIIYTILKEIKSYSSITSNISGCIWNITFNNNENEEIRIPSGYTGTEKCYFESGTYNNQDAAQNSAYNLLKLLDFNSDGQIDVIFSENNLVINSTEVAGIPYGWSTEVQIRRWR